MHWTYLLMLLSTAQKQNQQWEEFKTTYNKVYNSLDEETMRKQNFLQAYDEIQAHNERYKQGLESYEMGINEFSDQDIKEFEQKISLESGLEYSLENVNLAIQSLEEEAKKVELDRIWGEFKMTHRKRYKSDEEEMERMQIFDLNVQEIQAHNKRYHNNLETFKMGINQFTDMTDDEFEYLYSSSITPSEDIQEEQDIDDESIDGDLLEKPYMWYSTKIPVKNQGRCGSCWTFAATGTLEYAYLLHQNKIFSLSEQEFLDCVTSSGCKGGSTYLALKYAQKNGANFEKDYPYETSQKTCRHKTNSPTGIIKRVGATQKNEPSLQSQIKHGPFKVSVCASTKAWKHYHSGHLTLKDCNCNPHHAVVLVGAITTKEGPFYWIRNSWGKDWGQAGHIKLLMNQNTCHIADRKGFYIEV